MKRIILCPLLLFACAPGHGANKPASRKTGPTLDDYIKEAEARAITAEASPGSLFRTGGLLANLYRDSRATQVGDVVTIIVADRASASSKGDVKSSRASSANYSVGALAGLTRTPGPWSDLAKASGQRDLQGQGSTTRENTTFTTLSARVTHVLPNGTMIIAGEKSVTTNSEVQSVHVRGLIRREDVTASNTIVSDRIAELEMSVNGRGVVADAIKRPFILYRILLGLLPF
jgi:flagellar L-ring protein precursor FlgH